MKVSNETMETSQVGLVVKNPPARRHRDMGSVPESEDPLEMDVATHSSIPAWEIPWMEEPGGLQSTGLHRVGAHNKSKRWHRRDTERIRTERKPTIELP